MSSSDDSSKDRIILGGRFQAERRSGGLFERGLKDPVLLSPQAKAESLAAIGNIFNAVENEDIEKVRAILAIDQTQANARDHDRQFSQFFETPLLSAVVTGNLPIIKLLILNIADVNARTFFQDFDESYGWSTHDTPLHIAAHRGDTEVAECLLAHGADVNAGDWCGRTPLFIAATNTDQKMAELLLHYGAKVDVRVSVSEAAMAAPANSYVEVGATPLLYAIRGRLNENGNFHDIKLIELLIEHGANLDAVNRWGESALHIAADCGHTEAAKTLLKHGANPDLKDIRGMTPLDLARYLGNRTEVVKLLEAAPATVPAEEPRRSIDDLPAEKLHALLALGGDQYRNTPEWPAWRDQMLAMLGPRVGPYLSEAYKTIHAVAVEDKKNSGRT